MKNLLKAKLLSRRGMNVLIFILLILVLALAAFVGYTIYRNQMGKADEIACSVALKKAQDMLDVSYAENAYLSYDDALKIVERSKWEMDVLCPGGGDYYLVERSGKAQIYEVVCGLHDPDTKERTRLNATHAYGLVEEALADAARRGQEAPAEELDYTMNGKELKIKRLEKDNGLRWGTASSIDYEGVVCFYSLNDSGEINWFVYADEMHAAVWKTSGGWSGDAYSAD